MNSQSNSVVSQNFNRPEIHARLENLNKKIEQSTHKLILLEQKICLLNEDIERYIDEENKLAKQLENVDE